MFLGIFVGLAGVLLWLGGYCPHLGVRWGCGFFVGWGWGGVI